MISSATLLPGRRQVGVAADLAQLGGAVERHPAHELRRHVVLRLAPRLPDALIRFAPHLHRTGGLRLDDRPQPPGQAGAAPRVEQDRVEDGAEHVVLPLVERPVADAHGPGPPIAREVVEGRLGQVPPAVDAVHDLERAVVVGLEVGDELHELVGLPVEVEVVQRLERERRVPHPRVAVVPVALASGSLRQGRGERGDRRPRGHVGQALDRQRRPLDGLSVGVVGDAGPAQPGAPEPGRGGQAIARLLDVARRREATGPRQRAVHAVARPEDVTRPSPPALDAEGQVGLQPDGLTRAGGVGDVTAPLHERPLGGHPAVVEHRLAHELDLHLTRDALGGPHQHVVGIVVGRRSGVRRDLVLPLVRPHGRARHGRRPSCPSCATSW